MCLFQDFKDDQLHETSRINQVYRHGAINIGEGRLRSGKGSGVKLLIITLQQTEFPNSEHIRYNDKYTVYL